MSTSSGQITDLIAANIALKDFFEGERDALLLARNNLPGLIYEHVYVDTVNGLPGNDGTFEEPFASLEDAISFYKPGQHGRISLLSDAVWDFRQYDFRGRISLRGRASDNSSNQHRTVTFADNAGGNINITPGLGIAMGGVQFEDIDLVLGTGTRDAGHFTSTGEMWISFVSSDIDGAGGTTFLCDRYAGVTGVGVGATTFSSMGGRWLRGFAAGVAIDPVASGVLVSPNVDNT